MEKRGISGVIILILLILLILGTIVIVWNVVYSNLKKSSKEINLDIFANKIILQQAKVYINGDVSVKITREPGSKGNIQELRFLFYDKTGNNHAVKRTDNLPLELETKNYYINSFEINVTSPIERISVVPIVNSKIGLEIFEPKNSIKRDSNGNRILYLPEGIPLGLTNWFSFNGDMNDSIGKNNGTCTICPVLTSDRKGNPNMAYEFNGKNNHIKIPNLGISENGSVAVAGWFYPIQNASSRNNVIYYFASPILYQHFANDYFYLTGSEYFPAKPILNQWNHIILAYSGDSSTSGLYLNGIKYNVKVQGGVDRMNAVGILYIGYTMNSFNGSIDEIMIFNRNLSDSEIQEIYNIQK